MVQPTQRDDHGEARRPGEWLVAAGVVVFAVGLLATMVTVVPFFIGAERMPTAVYLLAMAMPLGLGIALAGLVAQGRSWRNRSRSSGTRHSRGR